MRSLADHIYTFPLAGKVGIGGERASMTRYLSPPRGQRTCGKDQPVEARFWMRRFSTARPFCTALQGRGASDPVAAPVMAVTLPCHLRSIALPLMRPYAWSVVGSRVAMRCFRIHRDDCTRPATGSFIPPPATALSRDKPSSLRPVWCGCPSRSGRCGRRPNPAWPHANAFPRPTRAPHHQW
jgi:hypothetical protein